MTGLLTRFIDPLDGGVCQRFSTMEVSAGYVACTGLADDCRLGAVCPERCEKSAYG